jgi:hypothetical protein
MQTQSRPSGTINDAISKIAYELVYNNTTSALQIWWCHKYNKPWLHDRLEEYSIEELLLEWTVCKLIDDPAFKNKCKDSINKVNSSEEDWLKREMGIDYFEGVKVDETTKAKVIEDIESGKEIKEKFM